MRISTAVVFVSLIGGLSACGSSPSAPTTTPPPSTSPPPSSPPPLPVQLVVFSDPSSTFMTSDVRDVQGQIVRFDMANHALIWAATDRSFSGYPVTGYLIGSGFQVRFGTEAGERRAYFTETGPATICDIDVVNGQLSILPTSVRVPGGG
jgi:hypothetical protein